MEWKIHSDFGGIVLSASVCLPFGAGSVSSKCSTFINHVSKVQEVGLGPVVSGEKNPIYSSWKSWFIGRMTMHIPSEWVWGVLVKSSLSKECTIHFNTQHRQFSFVWMNRIRNDWQWPSNRCFMKWWGDESARKLFFSHLKLVKSSIYRFQPFKIRPKTKNWMGHLGFTCVLCNCNMSMYTRLHELVCICVFVFFSPLQWRRFFGFIYFPNPRWENHHSIWRELLKG